MSDEAPPPQEPDSEHLTVLEALSSKLGAAPKLSLKDEDSEEGGSPLVKPASDQARAALPRGKGNYQLMGEIARGGMGVVLKGHDTDLGRDVALKVLHEDMASDPALLQRFVEEAQIGGQLQHPGIVPVYELGLMADERPFFTMKLVKGRTLSTLLTERDELDQDRRRFLSIFEQVCQTMAYAHSRDVLHRDLKPSNIMVGAFGEVQVVDWGLAKVLRRGGSADDAKLEEQTNVSVIETVRSGSSTTGTDSVAGSVLGTPAYMSPEQAQGNVEELDERCDVFTLGGVLCQILTGQPPYPGQKRFAMSMAAAADQTQVRARLAECGADAELVALTQECLAEKPADRPRNAAAVAKRVATYLASLEERAKRAQIEVAEARVRAEDERKARRLTVALAMATFAVLIVGSGSWIWISGERADRRQEKLTQDAEDLRIKQERVATRRRETEARVYTALSEAAFSRAQNDWRSAEAAVERARGYLEKEPDAELEQAVAREVQRRESAEVLANEESERAQQLAKFLDGMERNRGDLWLVTNPQYRLDAYEGAFEEFGIDLTFLDEGEVVGAAMESGRPADIALALYDLAWFHFEARTGEATQLMRSANLMDPDPLRTKVRDAVAARGDGGIVELARELEANDLPPITALILVSGLRYSGAKDLGIRILKRTARLHPASASVHIPLGELLLDSDPEGALTHLTAAQALRPESSYVSQLLGRVYRELGDSAEAMRLLGTAVELHPGDPQSHIHLGLALRSEGDEAGALDQFQQATVEDPRCLNAFVARHVNAGTQLRGRGLSEQAAWHLLRAIEMNEEHERAHNFLGLALSDRGLQDEAIDCYRRSIEINPLFASPHNNLGVSFQIKGLYAKAIDCYERAIEINQNADVSHHNLGTALVEIGSYEQAINSHEAALLIRPRDPLFRAVLGEAYYHEGNYHAALEQFEEAVALDSEWCVPSWFLSWFLAHVPDPELRNVPKAVLLAENAEQSHSDTPEYRKVHGFSLDLRVLGQAYYRAGQFEKCITVLTAALEHQHSGRTGTHRFFPPMAQFFLAMANEELGNSEAAQSWYDSGVEWMESHDLSVPNQATFSRWRDEAQALLGE